MPDFDTGIEATYESLGHSRSADSEAGCSSSAPISPESRRPISAWMQKNVIDELAKRPCERGTRRLT